MQQGTLFECLTQLHAEGRGTGIFQSCSSDDVLEVRRSRLTLSNSALKTTTVSATI